jgi:hypothetical protein
MKNKLILAIVALCGCACLIGWHAATAPGYIIEAPSPVPAKPSAALQPIKPKPSWQPPEGDPVQRYHAATTKEARLEIIGQFMTLGHDKNPFMLIDALKDESIDLRVKAVEYAASLTPTASALVLQEACLNDAKDVREMGWSLLAPHPLENKVPVLMAAIKQATDPILDETIAEMGRTPEMPLFEAMLTAAGQVRDARQARVFSELQAWLKPGGGNVPAFKTVAEMTTWWLANRQRYDQFMLRVDQ